MATKAKDIVLVHARTPDGKGLSVLRAREEGLEAGTLRPLEEGKPIQGEVVKLTPRPELPLLFDAETQVSVPGPEVAPADTGARRGTGPAQVATATYRKGWDAIFRRGASGLN